MRPHLNETDKLVSDVYEACSRRNAREPRRLYLGMSSIGAACELQTWLRYNGMGETEVDGRVARIFDMGHSVEARVIADLMEAGYQIDGRQLEFEDFDGRFKGHCDGVIFGITKEPHILEIKSANDSSFKRFQARGLDSKPAYAAQVQCYMGYSGLKRALFLVENKNNQELYAERVHFNPKAFEAIRAKAWRILNAVNPPGGASGGDCYFCDFRGKECDL